jgi:hypothetical protein
MPSGNGAGSNRFLALAGIQAGVVGALILLGYLALDSKWHGRSVWTVPNLLASTFYGEAAYRQGFGSRTSAGLALLLVVYGLLGALFGLVIRDDSARLRITLFGLIYGTAWFFLSFNWLWKFVNPIVPIYSPDRAMLVGHILYGGVLGSRFPRYLRAMSAGDGPEIPQALEAPAPVPRPDL